MSEAIYQLLVTNGYGDVVVKGRSQTNGFTPHVLLVDVTTVRQTPIVQCPGAKVLLIDTGIEPEKLFTTLLSHAVHGILSPHAELHLFKRALTAVTGGQIWIDNKAVKALLDDTGAISKKGRISRISDREREIIKRVCEGLSNREIAQSLALSQCTVKTHLNNIFRKFNITSRSKLITLAMDSLLAGSNQRVCATQE
jgi:DNA-binding NarL/FixJ family response regulator